MAAELVKTTFQLRCLSKNHISEDAMGVIVANCEDVTARSIETLVRSIDWKDGEIVSIWLVRRDNPETFLDVSGSLDEDVGISIVYSENGKSYIYDEKINPPKSMDDISQLLILYFSQNPKWKTSRRWNPL